MAELFGSFEVNKQSRSRALLGLVGGSLILHLTLAASIIYVPRFRDAFNIAVLAGQTNYVDKAYNKTAVGEDVQMLQLPKFTYPEGYFATEFASAEVVPTPDPMAPKIISTFTPPKPEVAPSPSPLPSASPSSTAQAGSAASTGSPAVAPETASNSKPSPSPDASDEVVLGINETEFNKRPLKDWLARANELKEKGTIDLNGVLEMTVDAKLNGDCRLEDPKVVQKSGDTQMVELAKELTAAIGDSRMLLFLKDPEKVQKEQKGLRCDPMALRFNVRLDQTDFNATVETEADSPERAAQLSGVYNWALAGGAVSKKGRDEEIIFRNTKVTAEGKQIVVRFKLPRQTAGEMLKKQIETKPAT